MTNYIWTSITEQAPFAPRDGAGALVFKDRMWLLGGWNPNDKHNFPKICNSEVWSSVDGRDWHLEVLQAPWEGRHCGGYVVFKDRMWIVGGDMNQGHYHSDVWSSGDGIHWDCHTDLVPWAPRVLHYTAAFRDKIWIFGGQTLPQFAPSDEVFYGDAWCSEDGVVWGRAVDELPFAPRGMIGGSVVFNDRLWILGGGTYDTPQTPSRNFYNEVWSTPDGVNWQQHPNAPWAPRQYHEVAVFDGKMWVMEGYNRESGNRNDVWFSGDGENWSEVPDTPWLPRHAASVFVHDNGLWMVAGNNMTPDVWKLTKVSS